MLETTCALLPCSLAIVRLLLQVIHVPEGRLGTPMPTLRSLSQSFLSPRPDSLVNTWTRLSLRLLEVRTPYYRKTSHAVPSPARSQPPFGPLARAARTVPSQDRKAPSFKAHPSWKSDNRSGLFAPKSGTVSLNPPEGTPSPGNSFRVGGRLSQFRDIWLAQVQDSWVQDVISDGYLIEFASFPGDRFFHSRPPRSPSWWRPFGSHFRPFSLREGSSQFLPGRAFFRVLLKSFCHPQKRGPVHPILDLKLLNRHLLLRHFRMESLWVVVVASMDQGEFLSSVDIRDACLHVPIFPAHQWYLRFAVRRAIFSLWPFLPAWP
ncbi:uncharacterized protein LOC130297543 [Hyla sarda]|uniref:uncharacterized protein LOC130297543 n=1 Tax=Hyla sarda TaxID=327740 RepID=UPI0024C434E6|nr:uncharacterized protein LOC130297543 [Hyla sarda]